MDQPQQPANEDQVLRPLAADFDRDPGRFAANQLVSQKFAILGDVHDQVADRFAEITSGPILDLGGGNGTGSTVALSVIPQRYRSWIDLQILRSSVVQG